MAQIWESNLGVKLGSQIWKIFQIALFHTIEAIQKTPSIKEIQQETRTDSDYFKYIISNFNETSEILDSDTNDEFMSL